MDIQACPNCGSRRIDAGTMNAGILFGITSWKSICKDCGYQGEPLLFDSEDCYKNFLDTLKKKNEQDEKAEPFGPEDDSDEVKKIIKDTEEEINHIEETFTAKKGWGAEIILSMILAGIWIILSISTLVTSYGVEGAILYSFLLFVVTSIAILFVIVIFEYFLKKIKKMLIP
ncbi:MAG: hypothetical protein QXL17_01400 [Candidatus Thermoplasmatota archaeon]